MEALANGRYFMRDLVYRNDFAEIHVVMDAEFKLIRHVIEETALCQFFEFSAIFEPDSIAAASNGDVDSGD